MTQADLTYRTLGRSGAIVSTQALGTMTFGAEADEATSHALIDTYVAAGGNFIDTADVYSEGTSEEIIGRWLGSHPTEARQIVLATKGRFPMGQGPNDLGTSRRHLRDALDASLRRLGLDHIDLYQLHAWDAISPLDETLRFLDDAVTAGKIGYYGFSNFTGWQLTKAVHIAERHGWSLPVTLQPQYNLLVRGIEQEIVPAALDAGLGLLPWSPLGGGWLSGKYRRDEAPTGSTRLGENPKRGMEAWEKRNSDERTWRVIDAVSAVAEEHGASHSQVSLAWLKAQPTVTSVILGARTIEQLQDNMGADSLDLSTEQLDRLTAASEPETEDYPYGAAGVQQRHRKMSGGR
ncbi:aryl-alcohol dehydrogenase (NADP+) [Nesterenkonia halotolerans]|uniref:Aryl-alcohol dehydrogenase (NADP+) n=1 Tax=Nesterenkonia halotolerans TaxID=225325 RepID=A0ABR9J3U7_9MICC|nr:aryl-alcohol dehydrogenase (NADP+) [Nesterenkonia halotolerans]